MAEKNAVLPLTKTLGQYCIQSAFQAFKQLNGAESALFARENGDLQTHSNLKPMNQFLTLLSVETSINFVHFS